MSELSTDKVLPAWSMLRPVLEDSLEFMQLVDSIRDHGQLQSVLVRKHPHREGYYEIIDGMWRYSAIKRLTRPTIHAIIYTEELTDDEYLALQIQCNAVSYETRPIEFAEQMMRMIELHDEAGISLSIAQMARIVGKSSSWVSDRLKLVSLCDAAKAAVRQGRLPIGKAAALAKIKLHKYQEEFLALAPKMNTREFQLEVGRFIALKRDEKKGMRRNEREKIQLRPIIRSMDEMLMELDKMANISQIIVQNNLTSAREGARIALEWVLHLDKDSRNRQVTEIRHKLTNDERAEVIGRRRYEQLKELEQLRNDFDNN